jgi:hypothetical protein
MKPRSQASLIIGLAGLPALALIRLAGQLGFAYWWPVFSVAALATVVGIFLDP